MLDQDIHPLDELLYLSWMMQNGEQDEIMLDLDIHLREKLMCFPPDEDWRVG